jgi:hypothetical protein
MCWAAAVPHSQSQQMLSPNVYRPTGQMLLTADKVRCRRMCIRHWLGRVH